MSDILQDMTEYLENNIKRQFRMIKAVEVPMTDLLECQKVLEDEVDQVQCKCTFRLQSLPLYYYYFVDAVRVFFTYFVIY